MRQRRRHEPPTLTLHESTLHGKSAPRGKAKQKHNDLRLVGLRLVVTRDGGIPVASRAYPGNRPDVTQFAAVTSELASRYRQTGTSFASQARQRAAGG